MTPFHRSPSRPLARALTALGLGAFALAAQAHPGHGTHGLAAGLAHPLGADHLLAMVAVGLWSVVVLPARRAWAGPATFLLAMVAAAGLGASGITLPHLEHALAASVVLCGLMLAAATRRLPAALGLGLIAFTAGLHGLAHGAEAPASAGFAAYAAGFLATTAALHFGGVSAGLALRRAFGAQAPKVVGALGVAVGAAGVLLLGPL